jgi:hypothetical protein
LTSQIALDGFFQFLVIVKPAAHLINALAADPELTCASSGVTHRQDKHLMPFAACVLRAILRSKNVPRSKLPSDRQSTDELLPGAEGITNHLYKRISGDDLRQL